MNILMSRCGGCGRTVLSVVNEKMEGREINDCRCPDRLNKIVMVKLTRNEWIELIKEGTLITSLME